jgi:fumarate reductase subunit D
MVRFKQLNFPIYTMYMLNYRTNSVSYVKFGYRTISAVVIILALVFVMWCAMTYVVIIFACDPDFEFVACCSHTIMYS